MRGEFDQIGQRMQWINHHRGSSPPLASKGLMHPAGFREYSMARQMYKPLFQSCRVKGLVLGDEQLLPQNPLQVMVQAPFFGLRPKAPCPPLRPDASPRRFRPESERAHPPALMSGSLETHQGGVSCSLEIHQAEHDEIHFPSMERWSKILMDTPPSRMQRGYGLVAYRRLQSQRNDRCSPCPARSHRHGRRGTCPGLRAEWPRMSPPHAHHCSIFASGAAGCGGGIRSGEAARG
mmetsp:Transcript_16972/g.46454  ORF Transcript_16972/g.46454 Transcript_16972/m.46454 type:complete len:235 (-) Transcript_16972:2419-3123(-)